jgi:hypothetical protein
MVEFIISDKENKIVCLLNGRFGANENEPFLARLTGKLEVYRDSLPEHTRFKVCFDMKNVTFIASAFIRICLTISREVDAENFTIINAAPLIKKTFMIAGLDKALNVS